MSDVTIYNPETGERGTIPESSLEEARRQGWRVEQPKQKGGVFNTPAFEASRTSMKQALTFGFADEIDDAISTLTNVLGDPKGEARGRVTQGLGGHAPTYQERQEQSERDVDTAYEQHPYAAYGADIGTSVVTPLGILKLLKLAGKAPTAVRGVQAAGQWAGPAGTAPLVTASKAKAVAKPASIMFAEGVGRTPGGPGERVAGGAALATMGTAVPPALAALARLGKKGMQKVGPAGRAVAGGAVGGVAGSAVGGAADQFMVGLQQRPESGEEDDRIGTGGPLRKLGTVLGVVAGVSPRMALQIWGKIRSASMRGDTAADVDRFLQLTPEGKAARQAAYDGDVQAQQYIQQLTREVTEIERLSDEVLTYQHTGLKPEAIMSQMAKDAEEESMSRALTEDFAERGVGTIDQSRAKIRDIEWSKPEAGVTMLQQYQPPLHLEDVAKETGLTVRELSNLIAQDITPASVLARIRADPRSADTLRRLGQSPKGISAVSEATVPGGGAQGRNGVARSGTTPAVSESSYAALGTERSIRENLVRNMKDVHSRALQTAEDFETLAEQMKDYRIAAGRKLSEAARHLRERVGSSAPDPSAYEKASIYEALDKAKRVLGAVQESVGRASRTDPNASEFVKELRGYYESNMRPMLEDASLWGEHATQLQKDINPAWHDWIPVRKGYARLALSDMSGEHAADPFKTRKVGDPEKLAALVKGLGTPESELKKKTFQKGLQTTEDLTRQLTKYYGHHPEAGQRAAEIAERRGTIEGILSSAESGLEQSRALESIASEGGPAGTIRTLGAYERGKEKLMSTLPRLPAPPSGGAMAWSAAGQPAAQMSVAPVYESGFEKMAELVGTAPDALGQWGDDLMNAAAQGDQELAAKHYELSEDNPEYRALIESLRDTDDEKRSRSGGGARAYSGTFDE